MFLVNLSNYPETYAVFGKVIGFLGSFGFSGHFKLVIMVDGNFRWLVMRSLGVLGHFI
mgnify:CR=1 FL=1